MEYDLKRWKWIEDSAHSWLCVTENEVRASGFRPSEFSYRHGGYAYLEEDCDAYGFLQAVYKQVAAERYGTMKKWYQTLRIPEEYEDGFCYVRNYPRFHAVKSNT